MMKRSWIRNIFARPVSRPMRKEPHWVRLALEALEDRIVPANYLVTNTNDTGAGSLRDAVAQANSNLGADTITFDTTGVFATPQTITLTSGAITFTDTALTTITGPAANVTVSGGNTQQVFWLNAGTAASISGLKVTGGNSGLTGGGIYSLGTLSLTNVTVSGNTATGNGGGIFSNGLLTMTDTTVSGNSASSANGGALYAQGTSILINCTISGNTAATTGGIFNTGTMTLTGSTLTGNSATGYGGALFTQGGSLSLSNCTVAANMTGISGGGIEARGTVTVTNCTFTLNTAAGSGGAIDNYYGGYSITVTNSILAGDSNPTHPEVCDGVISGGHNLVSDITGSSGWVGSDLTGTGAAPLNAQLGTLGSYGGLTQTIPLLSSSPAINAGNAVTAPATDQRGLTRFGNSDIGAFEYQFKVTNTSDSGNGSLRQAVLNANAATTADTVIFTSLFNTPQTITLTSGAITFTDAARTTITGPGASLLSISGNNASQVFIVNANKSAALLGLTVTGGQGVDGGGLDNSGTLSMLNCTVNNNVATSTGGGLANGGTLTMLNCTISGNTSSGTGGGLVATGHTYLTNCAVSGNYAATGGGGLAASGAGFRFSLTDCTVSGNTTNGAGGGLYDNNGQDTLTNCTVSGNTAATSGGGLRTGFAATLTNCTVSGNTATTAGGGLDNGGDLHIGNTIVAGNNLPNSSGPDVNSPSLGFLTSNGNNLIGKTDGSVGWVGGDLTGTIAAPLNPQLGALASNGGPTQTLALLPASPAIGAGNSALVAVSEVQSVTVPVATGTFTLTFNGQTTASLLNGASAVAVQNALNALASITGVGGSVIVNQYGDFYTITFAGSLANQNLPQMTGLGSGGTTLTIATVMDGYTDQRGQTRFGSTDIGAYEYLFKVTNITDSGTGSLRQAILNTNATAGGNTIVIKIGSGAQTITPTSALPTVTEAVTIDGTTQPGYSGTPLIVLNGASAGVGANGLTLAAGNTTVMGLVINGFGGDGIEVTSNNNVIQGNYIGTNAGGTAAVANSIGVAIDSSATNNLVGGTTAGAGNVISGNSNTGIYLNAAGSGNGIEGNYIGTNAAGLNALANTQYGIDVYNTANATIGGTAAGAGNVISANGFWDVYLEQSGTTGTQVQGNIIGLDATGTTILGTDLGVLISNGASLNTIGGTTPAARNVITAGGSDVAINGQGGTSNNVVEGNFIGTRVGGTQVPASGEPNYDVSIYAGAHGNTIGGVVSGAGNVIAGATLFGVWIYTSIGAPASNNTVAGNFIGTDAAGDSGLGNVVGVEVDISGNTIGGATAAAANLISGNSGFGIQFGGTGANTGNVVEDNYVGTGPGGSGSLVNTGGALDIANSSATVSVTGTLTGTGATNISTGTLQVGNGGTTGALTTGFITNNGALVYDFSSSVNLANPISGTGSVTVTSTGGAITQSAGINAATLTASASTGITLTDPGNSLSNFTATNSTSGPISLTNISTTLAVTGITQSGTAAGSNVTISQTGALSVTGAVSTTATANGNISLTSTGGMTVTAGVTAAGSGSLTLTANSTGTTAGNFIGIDINGATVQSTTGAVQLLGKGGTTGVSGVVIEGGGKVQTTGASGSVSITGTGGASAVTENFGVWVTGSGSLVTSGGGNVSVTGTGGGAGLTGSNDGVVLDTGGKIMAGGAGTVTVMGTGGIGGAGSYVYGVYLTGIGSQVTSSGGNVSVTGIGGGTGASATAYGVVVAVSGQITAGGTGTVTVQGTGGGASGGTEIGVYVLQSGSLTSHNGNVSVTGFGGGSAQAATTSACKSTVAAP